MKPAVTALTLLLCLLGGAGGASAQADTDAGQPPAAAPAPGTTSLSDQLSQSNGVIAPAAPAVDPGMVKATPAAPSDMPVVPPSGTEGGDQNVQPK